MMQPDFAVYTTGKKDRVALGIYQDDTGRKADGR